MNGNKAASSDSASKSPKALAPAPLMCPAYECADRVPAPLPTSIAKLFAQRTKLLQSTSRKGINFLEQQICCAIKHERRKGPLQTEGVEQKWPVPSSIDWVGVVERILQLKDDVLTLISAPRTLQNSLIWGYFLDDINHDIDGFVTSKRKELDYPKAFGSASAG